MANRAIFAPSPPGKKLERTTLRNEAGGLSYEGSPEEGLAQLALTGTFGRTFYATAEVQTETMLQLAGRCSPEYVAKCAVYARERGLMKDAPVVLLASLFARRMKDFIPDGLALNPAILDDTVAKQRKQLLSAAFRRVVNDTKALRNFAQVIRSDVVGRKSFGTTAKTLMKEFLTDVKSPRDLFFGSIGDKPTLGDVVKMVWPKPKSAEQNSVFRWLVGKDATELPLMVGERKRGLRVTGLGVRPPDFLAQWLAWKAEPTMTLPEAPMEMLTAEAGSDPDLWKMIARRATWGQTRQTLAAFARQGVFKDKEITGLVAERLANPVLVAKARSFPYSLMTTYKAIEVNDNVPNIIREAVLVALDLSLANVPELPGETYVFVDVSGSMKSEITGKTGGKSTVVTCREVAALYAAAIAARSPETTTVVCFHESVAAVTRATGKRVSYLELYDALCKMPSGGTNCSAPMEWLVGMNLKTEPSTVIYLSDNQSWIDSSGNFDYAGWGTSVPGAATRTLQEWAKLKARAPEAKLVCIDLQPYTGRQVPDREDVLNVGGFSNSVFDMVAMFAEGGLDEARMRAQVEAIRF